MAASKSSGLNAPARQEGGLLERTAQRLVQADRHHGLGVVGQQVGRLDRRHRRDGGRRRDLGFGRGWAACWVRDAGGDCAARPAAGGRLGFRVAREYVERAEGEHQDGDDANARANEQCTGGFFLLPGGLVAARFFRGGIGPLGRLAVGLFALGLGLLFLLRLEALGGLDDEAVLALGAIDLAADQPGVAHGHHRLAAGALLLETRRSGHELFPVKRLAACASTWDRTDTLYHRPGSGGRAKANRGLPDDFDAP